MRRHLPTIAVMGLLAVLMAIGATEAQHEAEKTAFIPEVTE